MAMTESRIHLFIIALSIILALYLHQYILAISGAGLLLYLLYSGNSNKNIF
jgi:hypothetical protein